VRKETTWTNKKGVGGYLPLIFKPLSWECRMYYLFLQPYYTTKGEHNQDQDKAQDLDSGR
jgi:hypothetical protein